MGRTCSLSDVSVESYHDLQNMHSESTQSTTMKTTNDESEEPSQEICDDGTGKGRGNGG